MLYLFFFVFFVFSHRNLSFGDNYFSSHCQSFGRLHLPSPTVGPEALAFDYIGAGPYASVADGRVLKWLDASASFVDFTVTSLNRSKKLCDGSTDPALKPTCGRPLGLGFNYQTGDLYIADAYHGLNVVGPRGGRATQLATTAEGVPFGFLNALDVDQNTGIVYFTDASAQFQERDFMLAVQTGDMTGRLMKYEARTQKVTVLLRGLSIANGVAISKDGSFVLISEGGASSIRRFWFKGPKANTSEIFLKLPGTPDNIRRNARGEFWIPVNIKAEMAITVPLGFRVSEEGRVLQVVAFGPGDMPTAISEVQEYKGALYIGSVALPFVGVYRP